MSIIKLVQQKQNVGAFVVLLICILLSAASIITASIVQRDFGGVEVSDVYFKNINGVMVRAKLFVPDGAIRDNPMPGMVYIHGYQNNRETGDAYSIETARRGIVVLNIDAIGRGHSSLPGEPSDPGFDPTYSGKSAVPF